MFKSLIILLFIVAQSQSLALDCSQSLPHSSILGRSLSPLWAQEYIGADLVLEELKNHDRDKVKTAVFDLGFESDYINLNSEIDVPFQVNGRRRMRAHHGTSVVNILNGPFGITTEMDLISLGRINFKFLYKHYWNGYIENDEYPRVISNSLGWGDDQSVSEVASSAHDKGTLWLLAAGNDYPKEVSKIERESKALLVGNFSPSGLTSMDSQIHESLLVLAPGNEELLTINGSGDMSMFGGSSGATPLVSGTIINLLSVFPELNRDNIFQLIRKTSFSSAENKLGNTNSPGLLNSYKALHVALLIKDLCPERSRSCISKEISNNANYINLSDSVIKCETIKELSCGEQNVTLKLMRRNALLGSSDQLSHLACAYRSVGLEKNAEYFEFISSDSIDLDNLESLAKKGIDEDLFYLSYYRYGKYFSNSYKEYITKHPNLNSYRKEELLSL